ncbi:50S ribosomal protein L29 [Campylobacter upsaliensis]|nr:50S ribosomal protein L29 [Campylobacter upsaliensis]
MKYTEIKDKTAVELNAMLKEKKLLLFTLKQKLKTMQLTNPKEISQVKKDIARINTAISAFKIRIEYDI